MADNWQLKAVLSAVDNMSPALKQVALTAKNTRKYLSDVGSAAGNLGSKVGLPLGIVSAALSGFSLMAVKNAVVGFTELGEALYKSSLRTGMSVEQLQRMKYVADQAGVPIEALEGGAGKLNKNIGLAAAGKSKDLSALFHKLGITARDSNGELRSATDILPELSDAFIRNKNPVVQARMGMALYGKSWQEMIPLLMEGSAGISASLERFKMLKGVMSLEDLKGAKDFGDQLKDVEYVTKGFSNTIAKELVPVLRPLIEDFIQWAAANRKVVAAGVKDFVKDLIVGLKSIDWQGVIDGARSFARAIGGMVDMVGGARNALIILAVVINAQTILAMYGLGAAAVKAGLYLAGLALSALAPVAPLQVLTAGLTGAELKAATMTATMGKLTAALGLAGAAYVGWQVGSWLNDNVVNPGMEALTGEKGQTLGSWIYDKTHPENNPSPSLVGGNQVKASGKIEISFKDMPPGTRVEQVQTGGDIPLDVNAGYREYAFD